MASTKISALTALAATDVDNTADNLAIVDNGATQTKKVTPAALLAALLGKGSDIASADPLVIGTDGSYFDVTGTDTIASHTVGAGRHYWTQFDAVLQLTHHATNQDLPGEANITTAAGDVAEWYSTGANTVQCVSYTKADGTGVAAAGGTAPTSQVFTSSGTYTKPAGLTAALTIVVGGGGGGGGGLDGNSGGSGGAGGGCAIEMLAAAAIGSTETVTIGAGGAAASAGGTTSFGSLSSATGGAAGVAGASGGPSSGAGGSGSGGLINMDGGDGHKPYPGNSIPGGHGGSSFLGGGGRPAGGSGTGTEPGQVGGNYGGGGGGGYGGGTVANRAGGAGAGGAVLVLEWY